MTEQQAIESIANDIQDGALRLDTEMWNRVAEVDILTNASKKNI